MNTVLRLVISQVVLVQAWSGVSHAQTTSLFRIDKVDSTQVVIQSDTLNRYDSLGRQSGPWMIWSSNEVSFTQTLEHLEDSAGNPSYSHSLAPTTDKSFWFPKVHALGFYKDGYRVGQWLGFSETGALEWVIYYDRVGNFQRLNMFTEQGALRLIGVPSSRASTISLRWLDGEGNLQKSEEAPIDYLP